MSGPWSTISFLSDYGHDDEFVGVVHSVIRSIAPQVAVVDVTHGIPPHDVRAGGLCLARAAQYLAPGVVVAVVDPGVGTARRAIAVEVGDGTSVLVGPDNGLLAPAVAMVGGASRVVELTSEEHRLPSLGPTFDGRDVFAPAAAHLCNGVPLTELGPEIEAGTLRPGLVPLTRTEGDRIESEVLWVDRYGNAQLNVDPLEVAGLGDRVSLTWGDPPRVTTRTARRAAAYAELAGGDVGLVIDSYGLLSIVLDQRSAADELGLHAGAAVAISPVADTGGGEVPSSAVSLTRKEDRP